MNSTKSSRTWISKKEVSEILGIGIRTIERKVKGDNDFPRPGRCDSTVRFKRKDIEEYKKKLEKERQSELN